MARLEVRLLGGFEASAGGLLASGFESRKARVLLAYLILRASQGEHSREQLAALFWPEADEETGRKNLRQALYSVRNALRDIIPDPAAPVLLSGYHTVAFNADSDYWLDVTAFERVLQQARSRDGIAEPGALAEAVQLYNGDLLSGYLIDASEDLEQWLLTEQERLREMVLEAVRGLVQHHTERGEVSLAIAHARRQLELDPLSEHAHRSLMRLYAASGRRTRALAQYETCVNMLRVELGVPPLAETTALHDAILAEEVEELGLTKEPGHTCPTVPMVGRRDAYAALRQSWERSQRDGPRLVVVSGEVGVGKTRLVKALVHDLSARESIRVLLGRSHERNLPLTLEPWRDVIVSAMTDDQAEDVVASLPEDLRWQLLRLVPEMHATVSTPHTGRTPEETTGASPAAALSALLKGLARHTKASLILVFDDIHWADPASQELLGQLLDGGLPAGTWVVATSRYEAFVPPPLDLLIERCGQADTLDRISVLRLEREHIDQLAGSVTTTEHASQLAAFLMERTQGLPLAIVEWINLLCDEGFLETTDGHTWRPARSLEELAPAGLLPLTELTRRRIKRLPESSRRLLTLASLVGSTFEAGLLAQAANEQIAVVELAMEVLLQRWMVRHYPLRWFESRRERDMVLWSRGARRGTFEFAHKGIRRILYEAVAPERRQQLHLRVADALATLSSPTSTPHEALGCQYLAAKAWERSLGHLGQAAANAQMLHAASVAAVYLDAAEEVTNRLASVATEDADR